MDKDKLKKQIEISIMSHTEQLLKDTELLVQPDLWPKLRSRMLREINNCIRELHWYMDKNE